jgi:hypothetical protein
MSHLPRLSEIGNSEHRRLLTSARGDAPTPAARKRTLMALGLGAAAAATTSSANAANGLTTAMQSGTGFLGTCAPSGVGLIVGAGAMGAGTMGASAVAGAVGTAGTAVATTSIAPAGASFAFPVVSGVGMAVKWIGIAAVSFSVGVGGGYAARDLMHQERISVSHSRDTSSNNHTRAGHPATTQTQLGIAEETPQETPADALVADVFLSPAGSARTEATLPLPPPHKTPGATPSNPSSLTVREEIALVEKARSALRHGDATGCLASLEMRKNAVRGGVLQPEATVLRIEALRALGQRDVATREALQFFRSYPDSPLMQRIRDLLEQAEE